MKVDLLVIGSGPGGEGAAMMAAKSGANVAVVEAHGLVGGNCTHKGTIPSKSLRYAVMQWMQGRGNADSDLRAARQDYNDYPKILEFAGQISERQVAVRSKFYSRNRVPVLEGFASFIDDHTMEVKREDNSTVEITAENIILATGSRPYHPENVDFYHPRICDSDSILDITNTPQTVTIYGAGVIGCEYASIFRGLDMKVNLVNTRRSLLSFLDDEITDALSYHLRDQGVIIRHSEEFKEITTDQGSVTLHLESGKKLRSDILLWANGRAGNSEKLNLAAVGLSANAKGQLEVNEHFQTQKPHIFAVGDLIGYPSLASAAYNQGRYAAGFILKGQAPQNLVTTIPTGIYTIPEISSLGQTEAELTDNNIPYEVGHAHFRSLAKAQITGNTVGMLKLLFHRESLEILGIHCFGYQASEIIHIGQAIFSMPAPHNTIQYFVDSTFNYPTMAEAYRVAALNGLNRIF